MYSILLQDKTNVRTRGIIRCLAEDLQKEGEVFVVCLTDKYSYGEHISRIQALIEENHEGTVILINRPQKTYNSTAVSLFDVNSFPAIIITGTHNNATIDRKGNYLTLFVKFEGEENILFEQGFPRLLDNLLTLFKSKKIYNFMRNLSDEYYQEIEKKVTNFVIDNLNKFEDISSPERKVIISFFDGRLNIIRE